MKEEFNTKVLSEARVFAFDLVFDEASRSIVFSILSSFISQKDLYQNSAKNLCERLLQGESSNVWIYGSKK